MVVDSLSQTYLSDDPHLLTLLETSADDSISPR